MERYLVERTFPDGLDIPVDGHGNPAWQPVIRNNAEFGVTWLHSYVSADRMKTFCLCDAPSPEALREAARRSDFPVDRITKVNVLDPYFFR